MAFSTYRYPFGVISGCFITLLIYLMFRTTLDKERILSHINTRRFNHTPRTYIAPLTNDPKARSLRIACLIVTAPKNIESRVKYINMTWGNRCDRTVYVSSESNSLYPVLRVNVSEGRQNLVKKCFSGLFYVYEHYFDEFDWLFKGDDDTYLIVENLRHFLKDYDTNTPVYFGHHFKTIIKQGYSSGGSGFVVSKEAMRRFGEQGNQTIPDWVKKHGGVDDVAFGDSMQLLGVKIGSSLDSQGRSRFHCFPPNSHVNGNYPDWYYQYDANGAKGGWQNMSDYPVSFHYIRGKDQLLLDYFFYRAHVDSALSSRNKT